MLGQAKGQEDKARNSFHVFYVDGRNLKLRSSAPRKPILQELDRKHRGAGCCTRQCTVPSPKALFSLFFGTFFVIPVRDEKVRNVFVSFFSVFIQQNITELLNSFNSFQC